MNRPNEHLGTGFALKLNNLAEFYMSACCRSEVFVENNVHFPVCPSCKHHTEWSVVLRRGYNTSSAPRYTPSVRRIESRLRKRFKLPEGFLRLVRLEWASGEVSEAVVVDLSTAGMSIETSQPPPLFSAVKLCSEKGDFISGEVRNCRPKGKRFIVGIALIEAFLIEAK